MGMPGQEEAWGVKTVGVFFSLHELLVNATVTIIKTANKLIILDVLILTCLLGSLHIVKI